MHSTPLSRRDFRPVSDLVSSSRQQLKFISRMSNLAIDGRLFKTVVTPQSLGAAALPCVLLVEKVSHVTKPYQIRVAGDQVSAQVGRSLTGQNLAALSDTAIHDHMVHLFGKVFAEANPLLATASLKVTSALSAQLEMSFFPIFAKEHHRSPSFCLVHSSLKMPMDIGFDLAAWPTDGNEKYMQFNALAHMASWADDTLFWRFRDRDDKLAVWSTKHSKVAVLYP